MPHASLKLIPGVDQNRTTALNEAAISTSNLIRFVPDRAGLGLPQKIGGWVRYYETPVGAPVRALWAWADTNDNRYLGVGAENGVFTLADAELTDRSQQSYVSNPVLDFESFAGLNEVLITDPESNITNFDSIFLSTHVSVGGLVLFGPYTCESVDENRYSVFCNNVIGLPLAATSSSTAAVLPVFDSTNGSPAIQVTLPNHGFSAGSTFPILVPVVVGNVELYGNYLVQSVVPPVNPLDQSSVFTIVADTTATATETVTLNNGRPEITYYVGQVTVPPSVGYGDGGYGSGGYGTGVNASGGRQYEVISTSVGSGDIASVRLSEILTIAPGTQILFPNTATPASYADSSFTVTSVVATSAGTFLYFEGIQGVGSFSTPSISVIRWPPLQKVARFAVEIVSIINAGSEAVVTFSGRIPIPVGSVVELAGNTPNTYDGIKTTTAYSVSDNESTIRFSITGSPINATNTGTLTVQNQAYEAPRDWTLDNWGEYLIANPTDGEIFYWSPNSGGQYLSVVPNSPKVNEGCFVAMPQRQIIAYGSTFTGIKDPLLVRWCDVGNFSVWAGTVVNQAGSFRIPKGSRIVGALQGPQQGLLWTDLGVWSMQYIGQPLIWSFNEVGTGCGLIGKKAASILSGTVYWMSQSQFFSLGGGGVQPIPCPVWDVIFQDIDKAYPDRIICATNARFGEVAWYYPTVGSNGEPNKYVKYNTLLGQWDFGELGRTAWLDQSVLGSPIGAGVDQMIYQHEVGKNAAGEPINAWIETGYFALQEGDLKTFVDQMWPDMKWGDYGSEDQNALVKISFKYCDYPGETPKTSPVYSVTKGTTYVTPRIRARLISIRVESDDLDSFWRLGNIRYRLQPDGKF